MPQTVQQTLQDPKFYGLPPAEQQKVLATLDPNYARLPLDERNKVLQMGQEKLNAPAAPAIPDLTTNSINPATGTGYGLYRMGSYDFNQGQVSKPEIQVPYDRVQDALAAGYSLHPDEAPRYQKDTANSGPLAHAAGAVKSFLSRMTEPMPDTPVTGSPWQQASAAMGNIEKLPVNVINRTARGLVGLPQGIAQTVGGIAQGDPAALESLNPVAMAENMSRSASEDTANLGPMAALGNLGGDAATMYVTGKYGPKVVDPMMDVVKKAAGIPGTILRAVTDTGEGPIKKLIEQKQLKNEKIADANTEAQVQNSKDIGKAAQQNRAAAAVERAKVDQAAKLQVGGSQLMYGLKQLDKALRDKANQMYGAVHDAMAGASLPSDALTNIVKAAQEKWIRGSPSKVAEFNAMLTGGSPGPELTLANQTAQNMGYKDFQSAITNPAIRSTLSRALPPDVWEAAIGQGTKPVSWNDLQGFYEETGAKIAEGPQPGKADIYKALQQVHSEIGNQMTDLAKTRNMDTHFAAARKFYREYMDTFHEPTGPSSSGSPVAQALLAKDPLVAVEKFSDKTGDRGVADLRRYSDSLANLAQDVQRTAQTDVTGSTARVRTTPVELKPQETISADDTNVARKKALETRANWVQHRGMIVATWPVFQAMRALWGGHIPSIPVMGLETLGSVATVQAITHLLNSPPMIEFLTRAQPGDAALMPPELRGDLPGLVSLAKQRGIKVAPALAAATSGAAGANRQAQQPVLAGGGAQ